MLSKPEFGDRSILIDPPANIDYGVTVDDLHSMAVLLDRQAQKKFRIRFCDIEAIGRHDPADPNFQKIENIVQMCFEIGDCTLAIDEIDMFCNAYGNPPSLKTLLTRGRHSGLNLIWTTRRPQEVSKLLLSQTDEFYLFQTHHPADVDYFRSFMPVERDQVIALRIGESLHWTCGMPSGLVVSNST